MIFDQEKWERIKNKKEAARQVYLAANEDYLFERGNFNKSLGLFQSNFRDSSYQEIHDAITQLARMVPTDTSALHTAITQTQAMAEPGSTIYNHLSKLLDQLLTVKLAEAQKEQAATAQSNHIQCFSVLEAFAKKHIKLSTSSGYYPVQDVSSAMGFNEGGHYE